MGADYEGDTSLLQRVSLPTSWRRAQDVSMGDNDNNTFPASPPARRDGNIDFGRYSTAQLRELQDTIDRQSSPLNYAALVAEMQRREGDVSASPQWRGRYTRRNGLRGWLEAKWHHSPLYGVALLHVDGQQLILHGRQRTWLGVPIERALHIPLERIRNVLVTARNAL